MKTLPVFFTRSAKSAFVAIGVALALAGSASGATVGLTFVSGGTNVQTSFLLPADTAGAPGYEQANWMTLGLRGNNGGGEFNVVDSSGANTGILLSWDAPNIWSVQNSGTPTDQGNPQINMVNAYLDSNNGANVALTNGLPNGIIGQANANKPLVYISGITNWLASQGLSHYDLVLYMDGDNQAGRAGEYWLQNASGPISNITFGTDMTTHVFVRDFNNFHINPVFQEVPQSSTSGRVAGSGNYTVFRGLNADSLLVRTAEYNTRAQINAIQIVPSATAGATLAPLSPSQTYAGGRATFRIVASGVIPMTFQWQKNGTPISDGGNISGATTANLSLSGVTAADAGSYSVVVSNSSGIVTSTVAPLAVLTPAPNSYAERIVTNNPVAYWRFNEDGDPATNNSPAYDYVGGFNAIYGERAENGYYGITGPRPPEFPGFEASNSGLRTFSSTTTPLPYPSTYVNWAVAPPLNLRTNTATFAAWIYPTASQAGSAGIIFARGSSGDVQGFGYGANNNLGYTWNDRNVTYNFASGLVPATNQWSFVACVVTPTNAILYLYNTNGQFSATNAPAEGHTNATFGGLTMIGDDPSSTSTPQNRAFTGIIDEAAVFARPLSDQELYSIFKKGLNVGIIPAGFTTTPVSTAVYEGRTALFTALASGDKPLTYQWRKDGSPVVNDTRITGANSPRLVITGALQADAGSYTLTVNNIAGVPATSPAATLSVVASNAVPAAYEAALRTANPIAYWRLNETSGANAFDYWGGNIASHVGTTVGATGPRPPEFVGMESTNAAASYDGLSSATDTGVSFMNNRAQFSIIGWFNPADFQIARNGLFGQNDVAEFGFHGADIGIWTPGGGFASFAGLGQSMLTPGQWYFAAATGDGSKLTLYLLSTNLTMQTSVSVATTNYGSSTFPFRIGGGGILDATGNNFSGQIDEVAIFDRALSASEIATLYGAAQTGGALPPGIATQPQSSTFYAGKDAQLSVTAIGSAPLQYQWRKGGVNIANSGNVSGATSAALTITNLVAGNAGDYDVVVSNSSGSVTSSLAQLTVVVPTAAYEAQVVSLNPVAYWRFNDREDPSSGTAPVAAAVGGRNGTYGSASENGFNGVAGPRPAEGFGIFEATNAALRTINATPNAYATVPALGITANALTITAWINPSAHFDRAGIVFARVSGGPAATGLNFIGAGDLNYHWLDTAASYSWDSGLAVPTNEWSFVTLVVEPTRATMYLMSAEGVRSATNVLAHASRTFSDTIRIGGDPNSDARTFNGRIDEVAIFPYALTPDQVLSLYRSASETKLNIGRVGENVILTWPQGTLLEAGDIMGPWTTNNAASPYTNSPTLDKKFWRVILR